MPRLCIDTPTGLFEITETDGAITSASWNAGGTGEDTPLLRRAAAQIADYFDHRSTVFNLPLRLAGSEFQRAVWARIAAIPFGETTTYGTIAKALSAPPQAVGQACGSNPIPLLVPCHRVLGAHGLGGFSGAQGVETKVWLLRHEGAGGLLI